MILEELSEEAMVLEQSTEKTEEIQKALEPKTIKPQHLHRYNEVDVYGGKMLAYKSCNRCYGTGIVGNQCVPESAFTDPNTGKVDYKQKIPIPCRCLVAG